MSSVWIMIKCDCGNYFGVKKGTHISCSRCGGLNEYIISQTFSSSIELHSAVSSANAPEDVKNIINSKIKIIEKKKKKQNFNDDNISKLKKIMLDATDENGILTTNNLMSILDKNSMININADFLIQTSESEGYIIRSGTNQWMWL